MSTAAPWLSMKEKTSAEWAVRRALDQIVEMRREQLNGDLQLEIADGLDVHQPALVNASW